MEYVSTDVDRILGYVRNRKRAELIEVARALGIKAMDVDKWAKILEKQGLIEIDYNLTKMYLIWKGRSVSEDEPVVEQVVVKRNLSKDDEGKPKPPIKKQKPKPTPALVSAKSRKEKPVKVKQKKTTPQKLDKPKKDETKVDLGKASELSMLLKNKVEAINQTVAEVADLKSEREKLYKTEYVPFISKFDSQITALGEQLAEREAALLSLKKRIVELPEAVAKTEIELRDSSKTLEEVEKEFRQQLEKLGSIRQELLGMREEIKSEIALSRNTVKSCLSSLSDVEEGIANANSIKEQAMQRIEEARQKIEEEQKVVENMAALIDGSEMQVNELREMLDGIMEKARDADATLQELESHNTKLDDAEEMIGALNTAYEQKISELREIAEKNEQKINSLRADVEKGFLHKYLKELNKLSEEHEAEANEIIKRDEDIELKLKTARERLKQLLKESRELSKKFESGI